MPYPNLVRPLPSIIIRSMKRSKFIARVMTNFPKHILPAFPGGGSRSRQSRKKDVIVTGLPVVCP